MIITAIAKPPFYPYAVALNITANERTQHGGVRNGCDWARRGGTRGGGETVASKQAERERARRLLRDAEAVIVAASNGFDIADGYNQFSCDDAFLRVFGDLRERYGLASILQGLMARWPSDAARREFLDRLYRYGHRGYASSPVMRALDKLTAGRPRFVVTCNCNGRFERAGFSSEALLETEGSYARLRCSAGCTTETWPAESVGAPDAEGAPCCPRCGALLDVAVGAPHDIQRLEPIRSQAEHLQAFLAAHASTRTVVLELGVGQGNRDIKRPLMAWAERAPQAAYVVVNREEPVLPTLPAGRAAGVRGGGSL